MSKNLYAIIYDRKVYYYDSKEQAEKDFPFFSHEGVVRLCEISVIDERDYSLESCGDSGCGFCCGKEGFADAVKNGEVTLKGGFSHGATFWVGPPLETERSQTYLAWSNDDEGL